MVGEPMVLTPAGSAPSFSLCFRVVYKRQINKFLLSNVQQVDNVQLDFGTKEFKGVIVILSELILVRSIHLSEIEIEIKQ